MSQCLILLSVLAGNAGKRTVGAEATRDGSTTRLGSLGGDAEGFCPPQSKSAGSAGEDTAERLGGIEQPSWYWL